MSADITFDALARLFGINRNLIQLASIISFLALLLAGAACWYARQALLVSLEVLRELKKADLRRVSNELREGHPRERM